MDGLLIIVLVLLGGFSCSHWISGSVLEVKVRPGDNITLYCDLEKSTGTYIVWFRNCSHENQPTLILNTKPDNEYVLARDNWKNYGRKLPRFEFVKNISSDSYDLSIMNVSGSDEGFYYCGTEKVKVEEKDHISRKTIYKYSHITTKVKLDLTDLDPDINGTLQGCGLCWKLFFSLCPAVSLLSALLSSLLVYRLCQKTATNPQADERRPKTRSQSRAKEGEDVCYAALEIRQSLQRPKTKRMAQTSDFSTYSAIKTSQM